MDIAELKSFLDEKTRLYQTSSFIGDDPISIPHSFTKKEDIEVSGILSSIIAWGNRKAIIKSCKVMMELLDNDPYNFMMESSDGDFKALEKFVYRTFQKDDLPGVIKGLKHIYANGGLESLMSVNANGSVYDSIIRFRNAIIPHLNMRTHKHIADVERGAAAKRINMFLRWMVREGGVDFGIWKGIKPSQLMLPLDVHSGNTSRALGILIRKQNDWKAVDEVTSFLRQLCPEDPVKYDFALFGLGVYEHFK